jgi:hypothetical protein
MAKLCFTCRSTRQARQPCLRCQVFGGRFARLTSPGHCAGCPLRCTARALCSVPDICYSRNENGLPAGDAPARRPPKLPGARRPAPNQLLPDQPARCSLRAARLPGKSRGPAVTMITRWDVLASRGCCTVAAVPWLLYRGYCLMRRPRLCHDDLGQGGLRLAQDRALGQDVPTKIDHPASDLSANARERFPCLLCRFHVDLLWL